MKRVKIKIGDLVVPKASYQTFLNKIGLVIGEGKSRHDGTLTYKVQFGEQVAIFSYWGLRKVTYENR